MSAHISDASSNHSTKCVSMRMLTGSESKPDSERTCTSLRCSARLKTSAHGSNIVAHFLRSSTRVRIAMLAQAREYNPVIGECYSRLGGKVLFHQSSGPRFRLLREDDECIETAAQVRSEQPFTLCRTTSAEASGSHCLTRGQRSCSWRWLSDSRPPPGSAREETRVAVHCVKAAFPRPGRLVRLAGPWMPLTSSRTM